MLFLHSPQTKLCCCTSATSLSENHETLLESLFSLHKVTRLLLTADSAAIEKLSKPVLVRAAAYPQSHRSAAARKKTERGGSPYTLASMQMLAFGKLLAASGSAVSTAAASAARSPSAV